MADMLSQAEIDALLGAPAADGDAPAPPPNPALEHDTSDRILTGEQKDILGEIGNISMGTAATTLFALLRNKVLITTPKVFVMKWKHIPNYYDRPCVGIRVNYTTGLRGANVLVLKESDVKIIANLMMGGDGAVDDGAELTELDMSAISEAMNQMVGSSSTSLSSLIGEKIDIDTPVAFKLDFSDESFFDEVGFSPEEDVALVSFRMEIGTLIDSEIMQLLPIDFALSLVDALRQSVGSAGESPGQGTAGLERPGGASAQQADQAQTQTGLASQALAGKANQAADQAQTQTGSAGQTSAGPDAAQSSSGASQPPPDAAQSLSGAAQSLSGAYQPPPDAAQSLSGIAQSSSEASPQPPPGVSPPSPDASQSPPGMSPPSAGHVNVQPARFRNFEPVSPFQQKENIEIIMDVPLEVTVELGRTRKKIREILEFAPGTIVELDKLAGEPIDIMVNGKFVAKGEVVVIDENFGIRITEIQGAALK